MWVWGRGRHERSPYAPRETHYFSGSSFHPTFARSAGTSALDRPTPAANTCGGGVAGWWGEPARLRGSSSRATRAEELRGGGEGGGGWPPSRTPSARGGAGAPSHLYVLASSTPATLVVTRPAHGNAARTRKHTGHAWICRAPNEQRVTCVRGAACGGARHAAPVPRLPRAARAPCTHTHRLCKCQVRLVRGPLDLVRLLPVLVVVRLRVRHRADRGAEFTQTRTHSLQHQHS